MRTLGSMLGCVAAMLFAAHTFYMPTVVFLITKDPHLDVVPGNLTACEYFVFGQMFLMFCFLQNMVVWGVSRAMVRNQWMAWGVERMQDPARTL